MSFDQQIAALNAKFDALMDLLAPEDKKPRKRPENRTRKVVLLSLEDAAQQQIASQKPHLARPTWVYLGKDVTCVWPLLDVICGPKRQELKKKAVEYIREHGLGWQTVGHKAHSDQGPIPVPKIKGDQVLDDESMYAPVADILRAVASVAPRVGPQLLRQLCAPSA